jgi:hypothetical protein
VLFPQYSVCVCGNIDIVPFAMFSAFVQDASTVDGNGTVTVLTEEAPDTSVVSTTTEAATYNVCGNFWASFLIAMCPDGIVFFKLATDLWLDWVALNDNMKPAPNIDMTQLRIEAVDHSVACFCCWLSQFFLFFVS